ncbi:MAG: crossover junction endodeoxyribonuclease RuvC [Bdellovibrionales bacterium RBG_16_40_8]|nr:MAG: crossover junction endodeoxyribonuclease RuvC [Bdellovibrionales bacterium RBG_16_40_8]
MSVIIGIDPGSLRTGWGVIDVRNAKYSCLGFGVIELMAEVTFAKRLAKLSKDLSRIIEEYQPKAMSVEKVFLGRNADSAFKLGHARGVAMAQAGVHHIYLAEYATRYVKKILTGSGAATKEQVQFMIRQMLGVVTDKLDATDALALAVCHGSNCEVREIFARQKEV